MTAPQPRGFTAYGLGTFYRLLLPGLRGGPKRLFFNRLSDMLVLGCGLGGAVAGLGLAGPLGAILGLGVGLAAGATFAERGRFYRG